MNISPEFLESDLPSSIQRVLLVLLALFVPPLPIYLLSGPNYSLNTKEFIICCLLTIFFFVIGVFYSVIFVLLIFPTARVEAGRDGYLRVGDIETQADNRLDTSHQSGDIQQPGAEDTTSSEENDPAEAHFSDRGKDVIAREEEGEPLPPSYDEIEGNSRGDTHDEMTKFGDNKVQR
ncbi:hypothetical protein METBIDRAFT_221150 [Metschnikowia bicuspidata var. bicuspidata NRRL YB-4993]|uniref:Uncharacterized protein n=1 Tax=Metschnikowia bicuspidata var. bicuspidata NRRL YB-4993 TaxID=869754 RepID=A0A1A0H5U2_9ASCO|nr:hypothetical protein METBIDRAFT_221150 [Metschnikowia bicuspidata var. bicuspidata NRRL YB-4993]OBA19283.1 hypothetical protein METBIDRAFT_221150 [Metschnikowia bicuspidata var. bicuspidata NRRL YB-4993]